MTADVVIVAVVLAPLCGWLTSVSRRRARRNPLQALGRVVEVLAEGER